MCSRILGTRELSVKHTGENIRIAVRDVLEEFGAWRPGNTYVTDNAANMKLAMKEKSWLDNLNLVLAHALRDNRDPDQSEDYMSEVLQQISVCKGIVAHVKRSRIQAKLDTTLKQAVSTRWNSILTMLQSVLCNTDNLKKLADEFADRTLQRSLLDVNVELLKQVVALLQHFDAATRLLSTDLTPSLHLVYPTKVQLSKKLQPQDGDGLIVNELKSRLMSRLEASFHIQPLHCLATLLDPRMKTGILSAQEKLDAVTALRALLAEVEDTDADSASCEPAAKKRKLDCDFFADLFATTTSVVDEVDEYLNCTDSAADVLSFWQGKEETWPKLTQCAKWILSTPATSTSSE